MYSKNELIEFFRKMSELDLLLYEAELIGIEGVSVNEITELRLDILDDVTKLKKVIAEGSITLIQKTINRVKESVCDLNNLIATREIFSEIIGNINTILIEVMGLLKRI